MLNADFLHKVNTSQGYDLIGYTRGGWLVENFNNASGALLEQDVFACNPEAKFITNAQGGYTDSIYVNGVLTEKGTFGVGNVLLPQTQSAATGQTVIETDAFSCNSQKQLTTEVRANANGVFETGTFTYSNNQLSTLILIQAHA